MQKNSKKYGFSKGDRFPVKLSIMGECVVIRQPPATNIVMSRRMLSNYGDIEGRPYVEDVGYLDEIRKVYGE